MTLDEATSKVGMALFQMDCDPQKEFSKSFAVAFAALQGITFEEPKSVNDRAREIFKEFTPRDTVIEVLDHAGLKIVEK
jgi:hypothetical protein